MRPMKLRALRFVAVCAGLAVAAPAWAGAGEPLIFPNAQYEPVEWSTLDGWATDDHASAFATFLASCRAIGPKPRPGRDTTEMTEALRSVCQRAVAAVPLDQDDARKFFEENFRPLRITKLGEPEGFLTGYYEPIIEGSRVPTAEFTAPLLRRPPNLVAAGRLKLGAVFPSKGITVGRRIGRRKIVPYYDRGQIEDGALNGWRLEICWLRDPVDVQFAQIQGSARIRLADGATLRVNYDSHNGWPFTPIGRVLIERKQVSREEVSMQRIREWLQANPDQSKDVRQQNKSYVFFRVTGLANEDEAVGGQGVPLVPGRSIAIDRQLHVYGTPFFIEADLPLTNDRAATKFRRLVVGQDTGSAIVGPARADIYFGAGDEAAQMAGRIKNNGRFTLLLPRELDPVEAGHHTPLPPSRPSAFSWFGVGGTATAEAAAEPEAKSEVAPAPAAAPKPPPKTKPRHTR